ncbi:MAG: tRNA (guanosine(46)-N7)-methyltransferase TrmB [Acholeplasmatales bacterium]|nr:MAG: tRNA (guanosine(46)-N7)-methyltransferase TrmB [Acholeplasmatales bacterium]
MRPRPVKGAADKIAAHPERVVSIGREETVDLLSRLPGTGPRHLEIGAGKGAFIQTMGQHHPTTRFIAVEKFDHAIVKLLDKLLETPLPNVLAVRADAMDLARCLPAHCIDRIYLNFSDPWPKARHAKRRLTHPDFLTLYQAWLVQGGDLVFKTDNRKFFEESICHFSQNGWSITALSLDLHADQDPENVMTEFEARFSQLGPIYRLTAKPKEAHA